MLSQYESFRKRNQREESFTRHGSLERQRSNTSEKRSSWNMDDYGLNLENFRPVTLTINSFFKQVVFTVVLGAWHFTEGDCCLIMLTYVELATELVFTYHRKQTN